MPGTSKVPGIGSFQKPCGLATARPVEEPQLGVGGQYLIAGFGIVDGYLEGNLQLRMAKYAQTVAQ